MGVICLHFGLILILFTNLIILILLSVIFSHDTLSLFFHLVFENCSYLNSVCIFYIQIKIIFKTKSDGDI